MWNRQVIFAMSLSTLLFVSGCGGGGGGTAEVPAQSTSNAIPVANAGIAQNLTTGSTASLDGSGSTDADNNLLTYRWTLTSKPAGSTANLSSSTAVNPTFIADITGDYIATLVVNDGQLDSNPVSVTITASNANLAPVANAGTAQNVLVGATTTLNGANSSDANGDAITYAWSMTSKPSGSSAALANASTVNPTFAADIAGSYVLSLVVSDGSLSSAASTVTITASTANIAPVANAGAAQSVVTGSQVTLNGSASNDANGDALTYTWAFVSRPTGSTAALSSTTSVNPTFTAGTAGSYVLSLVVRDGALNSVASTVTITASNANLAPVANAGSAQNVLVGATTTLNGANSSDANGDAITYAWSMTSKPSGSTAALANASTVNPTFAADIAGSYVMSLVVSDGSLSSAASTVTVTASTANIAPVANAGAAQSVLTGSQVTLNGSASNDANGDALTYTWAFVSRPTGSTAALSSTTSVNPTFTAGTAGSYVLSLVVNDGTLNSVANNVTITASNANLAPVALAGGGLNATVGNTVILNGTGSYDPNGDPLIYAWAFVSRPSGSSAVLSGSTTARPSFIADRAGSFVIALAVGDGSLASQISTVTITASPPPIVGNNHLYLYGGLNNSVYLGCLTCNQFDSESICSSFGTYGNPFNNSSIWSQFGTYGNPFQPYSPWNSNSYSGPLIVDSNNVNWGFFTTNAFKANRTTIPALVNTLNFYSSTNNLASTRTYFCGN